MSKTLVYEHNQTIGSSNRNNASKMVDKSAEKTAPLANITIMFEKDDNSGKLFGKNLKLVDDRNVTLSMIASTYFRLLDYVLPTKEVVNVFGYKKEGDSNYKYLSINIDGVSYCLIEDISKALYVKMNMSKRVSENTLSFSFDSLSLDLKKIIAKNRGVGFWITFTDNIFKDDTPEKQVNDIVITNIGTNQVTATSGSNQVTCPSTEVTKSACDAVDGGVWISSTGSSTDGRCVCCNVSSGDVYVDQTDTSSPCKSCGKNAKCGDKDGQCKGSTGDKKVACKQNPTTKKWAPDCATTSSCTGQCPGSCGVGEWFLFKICKANSTGTGYSCVASAEQWRSWVVWIVIFFLIILSIVLFVYWL